MAKSFWQRGEDYAKKVSSEIIDQIKAGVAPWQKPWKPGRTDQRRKLLNRQEVQRRQQPLPDEPGASATDGETTVGAPTTRFGKRAGRSARARKGRRFCSSRIATVGLRRTRKGRR